MLRRRKKKYHGYGIDWEAAQRRAASLPTGDLVTWAEQSLFYMGRMFQDLGRDATVPREAIVDELDRGVESLAALVSEIRRRL